MAIASVSLLVFALASGVSGDVLVDFNCTSYIAGAWTYTSAATACENAISDASCVALFPAVDDTTPVFPEAGTTNQRPYRCYTTEEADTGPIVSDMKAAAIATCPKHCGYCCQTDAYSCSNAQFPRLNCNTITRSQCNSVQWRTIIAQDCPSACGFCNQGGCVDAVTNCATDLSICNTVGMQDFVNAYCQKTCARCPSTTASGATSTTGSSSGSCTSYIADSSTSCAAWATNGFCTNTFYTYDQRRARCATTCRLC